MLKIAIIYSFFWFLGKSDLRISALETINTVQARKRRFLLHYLSNIGFQCTVVNRNRCESDISLFLKLRLLKTAVIKSRLLFILLFQVFATNSDFLIPISL